VKPIWIVTATVVTFAAGWLVGGSGRSAAELSAGRAAEQAGFLEARVLVLEGQVNLLQSRFGDARTRFAAAGRALERLQTRLRETGQAERAGQLQVALAYLGDAAEQAETYNPDARDAAEAALRVIEKVGGS